MKYWKIIFLITAFIILPASIYSKTLWRDKNIYASGTNLKIGDIIVVNINDISQLRFNMTLNNDNSFNIISNPDTNLTGYLPKVSSNKKITSTDKADFSGRGGLNISIASRIMNRLNDGKLTIAGVREYSFSGKINRFVVSGILDPELVKGRSVMSKDVANFKLEIRGLLEKGEIEVQEKKLNEGESAGTIITEEEKQKIITDYLNKMLREITR